MSLSVTPELAALLATRQFVVVEMYTFTLLNGSVFRYTSYDTDVTVLGTVYKSRELLIKRDAISNKAGFEVSTMQLEIDVHPDTRMGLSEFIMLCHDGGLDGARVQLDFLFLPNNGSNNGIVWA